MFFCFINLLVGLVWCSENGLVNECFCYKNGKCIVCEVNLLKCFVYN